VKAKSPVEKQNGKERAIVGKIIGRDERSRNEKEQLK
jgi:hypothetical protein